MNMRIAFRFWMITAASLWLTPASATLLLSENFQSTIYPQGTDTYSFPNFSEIGLVRPRNANNNSDVPGSQSEPNQVLQLEWTNAEGWWDIPVHTWSADDVYQLSFNASPQSWNGAEQRFIWPSLRQQDNTVLWNQKSELPLYNNFGRNPWTPEQTFTYTIPASSFTTGTEGSGLRLYMDSDGFRGLYFDNVVLSVVPEPSAGLLLGFGGLIALLRRRF